MERQKKRVADEKARLFQHRLQMESNRRNMASKTIVAFTKQENGDYFHPKDVCGLLPNVGFSPNEVEGVVVNCF